ncbi:bardet-Biedl syndrome 2 protein homolog [Trichonephila clavata]|uniref:Bardet-Biedl syndrome 2 protein homolog n=1 Tax=Trichonephila clavata TaxID=2740835 RepID=A0A8X6LA40_TRICU|nr:bardet-Biedl syndrome 2 protein homolog [Trichonephila clavata]
MLAPVFSLNLSHKILPHRVTIGKYDGIHPCLTAATASDKIFVHNPHQNTVYKGGRWSSNALSGDLSLLNINQSITCVAAGQLKPDAKNDILVVGTATNLLAYDVDSNTDLFYKDVHDGANCLLIGHLGARDKPMAIVGGNCSLQGFDHEGNDVYWTVTGDNVSSITLCDFNHDSFNELIVGSEDFDIRVFRNDVIIAEMTETEAVTGLCKVMGQHFGYALANGTVGVYKGLERAWRIKSKNQAICLNSYDIDGDGVPEIITGWSNGKIDARNVQSGEVVFKDNFSHCIAGIVKGDYRLTGKEELIFCATDGEVRGYEAASAEMRHHMLDANFEQETIRDLSAKKQALLLEFRNYEENARIGSGNLKTAGRASQTHDEHGIIPATTQLKTGLSINLGSDKIGPHIEVSLETTNNTIIRCVLIFAEGIFDGESHVVHPKENQLSSAIHIPLWPPKDLAIDLHIKAMIGYKGSVHFHVFELTRQLPRFSMYALTSEHSDEEPESYVKFFLNDRVQRVVSWINNNFLLMQDLEFTNQLNLRFTCLRSQQPLLITMDSSSEVFIKTDDMELAGELIQSLAQSLTLEDLSVTAHFPQETENVTNLLTKVNEYQSVRQQLSADMADNSGLIRNLVVRAEDARLMRDYALMRRWHQDLHALNGELINNYKIRSNNHEELMTCLKQVNQVIQRAGRLRVGRPKTQVINSCRAAIKNNDIDLLVKVIRTGEP